MLPTTERSYVYEDVVTDELGTVTAVGPDEKPARREHAVLVAISPGSTSTLRATGRADRRIEVKWFRFRAGSERKGTKVYRRSPVALKAPA